MRSSAVGFAAHVTLGRSASVAAEQSVLAPIHNLPTSPRSATKKQRLITECGAAGSPATPAQLRTAGAAPAPAPFECSLDDLEDPLAELLASAHEMLREPSVTDASEAPLGREAQHARLVGVVESFAASGQGQSLYVSGLPGTGKSHTVSRALQALDHSGAGGIKTLWINCMAVSGAGEVYGRIHAAITGGAAAAVPASVGSKRGRGGARGSASARGFDPVSSSGSGSVTYEQVVAALSDRASGGGASTASAAKRRRGSSGGAARPAAGGGHQIAIVLDEVDALVGKGQQVRGLV